MCGICGIADFDEHDIPEETVETMVHSIRHRGPDDAGIYACGPVALGHTRLSIIDLSHAGRQPMISKDGNYVLVYNGELYNHPDLRQRLEGKGYRFVGHSDTETLLNAYQEWGVDSFSKFEGMFAFALWDGRTQELHLVRDRFGIKPLYYYPLDSGIVFGSEVKAMLASRRMKRELDWEALCEYLHYGTGLGENSLFKGVRKLLPGHRLTVHPDGWKLAAYASIHHVDEFTGTQAQAIEGVKERMDQAVKSHLISDVPVGVFLSGGIDSSTITALASKHYEGRLSTYSAAFDFDKGTNELAKARRVAEHFGTDHHELHIQGKNLPDVIERLVCSHDEPFGDMADVPLYLLCEQLKGSVKVVLQGDGGDEIFAGYRSYNVLSAEQLWHWAAKAIWALRGTLPKSLAYYRYMRFFQAMAHDDPAMRMALLMTEEPLDSPPTRVLSADARSILENHDPYRRYRHFYERFEHLDAVQRMLFTDCAVILPDIFLEKVDKSTMAHGIEVRVPMLDTNLAHYVMGLPSSMKVKRGQKKWIIRQAMRGIVPDEILDGPKTGFGVPYSHWLRTSLAEYMRSVLFDPSIVRWGLFDSQALHTCVNEHLEGTRNNGFLLYKLLNLVLWYQFYLK